MPKTNAIKTQDGKLIERGEAHDDWLVADMQDKDMRVYVYLEKADDNEKKTKRREFMVGNLEFIDKVRDDEESETSK